MLATKDGIGDFSILLDLSFPFLHFIITDSKIDSKIELFYLRCVYYRFEYKKKKHFELFVYLICIFER